MDELVGTVKRVNEDGTVDIDLAEGGLEALARKFGWQYLAARADPLVRVLAFPTEHAAEWMDFDARN